jgi:nitrite reductase/ring-hydroxylating ferredoxin subunit
MAEWIPVGSEDLLDDGEMKEVQAAGQTCLLVRVAGSYYSVQPRCPHMRGRLVRGSLKGTTLTCPVHGSTFDVTNGHNLAWVVDLPGVVRSVARALSSPKDLQVYETKVTDGQILVQA